MANPRQRRKARSSSHKPVSHSKHAKRNLKKMPPLRAPKVLQDAWDKRKTVRQNYAALGLIHDLNPSAAGGAEIIDVEQDSQMSATETDVAPALPTSLTSTIPSQNNTIPKGYGKIVRDEAGRVVRIELPDEEQNDTAGLSAVDADMDMEQSVPQIEESVREKWVEGLGAQSGRAKTSLVKESVVGELDKLSTLRAGTLTASLSGVGERFTSQGEREYLEKLVEKHGRNVEKMARDRRLNPEQRTEGELKRAMRRAGLLAE